MRTSNTKHVVIKVKPTLFFSAVMEECPICLESFGLDQHIPKSLDCRHAVCTECMRNAGGQPLQRCPICRRAITDHSTLPNDLTLISYLEKNKREKYLNERKEKVKNLIEQVLEASEDVDGLLKEQKVSNAQAAEERSVIFSSYINICLNSASSVVVASVFWPISPQKLTRSWKSPPKSSKRLWRNVRHCLAILTSPRMI